MASIGDQSAQEDINVRRSFRGHKDAVTSVVFNPNMKQVISGSLDGAMMMWNFRPHLRPSRYTEHTGPVLSVAVSNAGGIVASGSKDRTVRLWTPNITTSRSTVIKAHTGGVRRVAFSADSCSLLSASDDKTIKVWSVAGQKFRQTLSGHSNWVRAAAFNSSGDMILSGGDDKTVRLWDLSQRSCVHTFHDHTGAVNDVHFHPDGICIAACSSDTTIKIWDLRMQQLLQHYAAHNESVNSIDIHPSGDYLISASSDSSTKIWDLREGHICYTLQAHDGPVNSVAFSPEGDFFATASSDRKVLVWENQFNQTSVPETRQSLSARSSQDAGFSTEEMRHAGRGPVPPYKTQQQPYKQQPAAPHAVTPKGMLGPAPAPLPSGPRADAGRRSHTNKAVEPVQARPAPAGAGHEGLQALDVRVLQQALESIGKRMEEMQETVHNAVETLDQRLSLAELRLARLDAPHQPPP